MSTCPSSVLRSRARSVAISTLAAAGVAGAVTAPPASATSFRACASDQPRPVQVGSIGAAIEGAVVDRGGRLYVTDLFGGRIVRFDAPGAAPKTVAVLPGRSGGGALALEPDGTVIVGGGADPRVFLGDVLRPGYVSRLNPETGALTQIARGFSAANGLAVTTDGTIYATNDFGELVGRRLPDGRVQAGWARIPSANGAALDRAERYLYVGRTFVNAGVSRIPLDAPARPERLLTLQPADAFAAPDGLTLDAQDRPVVPLNAAGEVIRIDAPGQACRLARGLQTPSLAFYGKGDRGFSAGHLYTAGFDGKIHEIPAGFDAGA